MNDNLVAKDEVLLRNAYQAIRDECSELMTDSFDVAKGVHAHRYFWKPERVKTVLLAESHVFTTQDEVACRIKYPDFPELVNCPREFVRVVYCLGAGERTLVDVPKNPPKTQFWKIFSSCVGNSSDDTFNRILKNKTPDTLQRIRNKVDILVALKERGIWLMDASVIALYGTKHAKPSSRTMDKAIEISWKCYVGPILEREDPANVIVIGKGVAERLNKYLPETVHVCPQPQARLTSEQHRESFLLYNRICNS